MLPAGIGKLAAVVMLAAASFAAGWLRGARNERAAIAEREARREASIAAQWLDAAHKAAQSTRIVLDALGAARAHIATTELRTVVHVREVSRANTENPDLAGVRQPDAVVRLHAEAVAQSAAAADRARRSFDRGLAAVRAARAGR